MLAGTMKASIDAAVAIANAKRYDEALNMIEQPPNGDDYNAIMEMLNGAPYRPPHTKGR